MKQVIVYARTTRLTALLKALASTPLHQISYSEIRGYGRQKGHLGSYRQDNSVVFLPKIRLQFSLEDERVEEAVEKVSEAARTGRIGDGKILVVDATTPEALKV